MNSTFTRLLAISFLAVSCGEAAQKQPQTEKPEKVVETVPPASKNLVISSVEKAHNTTEFKKKSDISFDIELTFGGSKRLEGNITLSTDSRNGKITKKNDSVIVFSDGKVTTSSNEMNAENARFSAYTWPYFFMFPYKLTDEGTIWNPYKSSSLNGSDYLTQKLTFKSGTGDAPDDWYILYADKKTKLARCAAYIVTAKKSSQEEAEEDPHAIEYLDYQLVDGIPMSHEWKFWAWRTEEGLTDQLGFAKISNIQFLEVEDGHAISLQLHAQTL